MLSSSETFWLQWQAEHAAAAEARQARALLALEAGAEPAQVAAELRLTPAAIERLVLRFEAQRLTLFPRPGLYVEELLTAAHVDLAHAHQVAEHALRLFDETQAVHKLPAKLRALLETAALLHNLGLEVDAPKHHTVGRDLLQGVKLVGHTAAEQTMLACAVRFHRKTVRAHKEPLFMALGERQRAQTLALSALLRIADGLDYSQSQTTRVEAVRVEADTYTLTLSGPYAEGDGARAVEKADLWAEVLGGAWVVAPPIRTITVVAQTALTASTPLATVAVRALAEQLTRWEAATAEACAGAPPAIKAVRAAARRGRAALEMFRPALKKKRARRLRAHFKAAEDALAAVRDWDVLIAAADEVALMEDWPFLADWRAQRQTALSAAARWLDGDEAAALRADWADFVTDPPAKRKGDARLGEAAAALFSERVEQLREQAADLDPANLESYHALRRLAVKRVRFLVEFLLPALGEPGEALLRQLVKLQDRLGYLNDACVGRARLAAWLAQHPDDDSARRYDLSCQAEIQKHLRKFGKDWEAVQPDALTQKAAALLTRLQPETEAEALAEGPHD